jgi:phytoene synthase
VTRARQAARFSVAARSIEEPSEQRVMEECRAILSRHARSFRWASLFLPKRVRDDAVVLYAFCRELDDAVDNAPDRESARKALSRIIDALHQRSPVEPIAALFKASASRLGIDLLHVKYLIEGIDSDLGAVRIRDDAELLKYCYRVASTVGLMMCSVLRVVDRRGLPHAIDLGIAMQLTNICRDVAEDANRDRVYLPAQSLERLGLSQSSLVQNSAEPEKVAAVVRQLLALAEQYYRSADRGMRYIPYRPRLAIIVASRVYRAIGRSLLRRHDGNPFCRRAIVPWHEKLFWVCQSVIVWLFSLFPKPKPGHEPRLHRSLCGFPAANC